MMIYIYRERELEFLFLLQNYIVQYQQQKTSAWAGQQVVEPGSEVIVLFETDHDLADMKVSSHN